MRDEQELLTDGVLRIPLTCVAAFVCTQLVSEPYSGGVAGVDKSLLHGMATALMVFTGAVSALLLVMQTPPQIMDRLLDRLVPVVNRTDPRVMARLALLALWAALALLVIFPHETTRTVWEGAATTWRFVWQFMYAEIALIPALGVLAVWTFRIWGRTRTT